MQYFKFFLIAILSVSFPFLIAAQPTYTKISKEEVGEALIEKGGKFLNDFFATMKQGNTYDFTEISTPEVASGITPDIQKQVNSQLLQIAGEYEIASFKEAWVTPAAPDMKIIRYLGKFSKGVPVELRVVYNLEEKIAGYFAIPWKDQLQ